MRNAILIGTIGAALAFGAANAYAFPASSPYAIWSPQGVDQGFVEGRAAYVDGNGMAYGPTFVQNPEDYTYYSRGR
jgi:hypothetical protein